MIAVVREGRAPQLAAWSRGLLLHLIALGVLLLGTAALALARVDGAPGTLPTAAMLVCAWVPQALPARRAWVRVPLNIWTGVVVAIQLGWWSLFDLRSDDNGGKPRPGLGE
jgi:hypothetical protein